MARASASPSTPRRSVRTPSVTRRKSVASAAPVSPSAAAPSPAAIAPAPVESVSEGKCPVPLLITAPLSLLASVLPAPARLRSPSALIAAVCLAPCVYAAWQLHTRESPFAHTLSTVFALAVAAFAATMVLIPPIAELNKKAELFGIDINKRALLPAGQEPDKM